MVKCLQYYPYKIVYFNHLYIKIILSDEPNKSNSNANGVNNVQRVNSVLPQFQETQRL